MYNVHASAYVCVTCVYMLMCVCICSKPMKPDAEHTYIYKAVNNHYVTEINYVSDNKRSFVSVKADIIILIG